MKLLRLLGVLFFALQIFSAQPKNILLSEIVIFTTTTVSITMWNQC